ncbi:formimidoylglutamate deiminase [Prosthecomicrobium sp. N25]|uniref:formimidoylglutamate deiminase n=1 Tax=Prosthecomicrobium sp. N25 TaxID=3129254 RepID=UPI003077D8BE
MAHLHAGRALLPEGWAAEVRLTLADGRIVAVEASAGAAPGDERVACLLPGMPDLHSHAFQRAMAGLTERRGPGNDSFWSWRDLMYRFALAMSPDDVEAVAAELQVEMLEAGFTRVGEFHYLHHAPDGHPYEDPAEMAVRIAAAAAETGIGLTLLPVLYARAGFGGAPAGTAQRRFVNDPAGFARLHEAASRALAALPGSVLGVAPHSLRAVTPDELEAAVALAAGGPVHIHVAEQTREVEDCLAWSGARPVAWLLDHAPVDPRWCLVHATHMDARETAALAATGAVAGLCPLTEANLGDGIFPAADFRAAGGAFGIGSDSNVEIGLGAELRMLEYSQRLRDRARNVLAPPEGSTGLSLFAAALAGGARALGAGPSEIAPGAPADLVALSPARPGTDLPDGDALLDAWIFAPGTVAVDKVWVRGVRLVEDGRHRERERIGRRFGAVMERLAASA